MERPALKFTEEVYGEQTVKDTVEGFQERGFAILPRVFEPVLSEKTAAGRLGIQN